MRSAKNQRLTLGKLKGTNSTNSSKQTLENLICFMNFSTIDCYSMTGAQEVICEQLNCWLCDSGEKKAKRKVKLKKLLEALLVR